MKTIEIRDRVKELRRVRASDLRPAPDNWRIHPKAQSDALMGVLKEIGFAGALLVRETPDGLELIDGHLRRELTPDMEVPVLVLDVNEAEAKLLLITYDPLSAMAAADKEKLDELLRDVQTGDAAVMAMLSELAKESGLDYGKPQEAPEPQIDRAAELQAVWQTALGQIWEIPSKTVPGKSHRLLCGDSTKAEDVGRLMGGEKADVTFTDPPYGVGMEYGMHEDKPEENEGLVVRAFALGPDSKIWTPGLKNLARELTRESRVGVLAWNRRFSVGWPPHGCSWATVWEPILVTNPRARKLKTDHFEYMTDRIMVGEAKLVELHPCPKSIELWCELLEGLTDREMVIYDPFLGSGTTIVACERLGRKGRGIEISPAYVAVSLQRLADMGLEPRLCPSQES